MFPSYVKQLKTTLIKIAEESSNYRYGDGIDNKIHYSGIINKHQRNQQPRTLLMLYKNPRSSGTNSTTYVQRPIKHNSQLIVKIMNQ